MTSQHTQLFTTLQRQHQSPGTVTKMLMTSLFGSPGTTTRYRFSHNPENKKKKQKKVHTAYGGRERPTSCAPASWLSFQLQCIMWLAFSFLSFSPFQFLATWNSSPWPWQPALGRPDPDLVPCKQRHSVTLSPAMPFVNCTRITASGCHGDAHRI